jgi:hypothetical protein
MLFFSSIYTVVLNVLLRKVEKVLSVKSSRQESTANCQIKTFLSKLLKPSGKSTVYHVIKLTRTKGDDWPFSSIRLDREKMDHKS